VGCDHCGQSGYSGRRGVYELLTIDDEARALIHSRAAEADILTLARSHGMRSLREDAQRWLLSGTTSLEEVLRVTGN
jgi:general secretion pathway protein E